MDSQGNLYITDKQVFAAEQLKYITGSIGTQGVKTTRRWDFPQDIVIDAQGNLYITDMQAFVHDANYKLVTE